MKKKMVFRTITEKQTLVEKVQALTAQGQLLEPACKTVGIKVHAYYNFSRDVRLSKEPKVITYQNTEAKPARTVKAKASMKLIALVGDAEQVMAALRNLS